MLSGDSTNSVGNQLGKAGKLLRALGERRRGKHSAKQIQVWFYGTHCSRSGDTQLFVTALETGVQELGEEVYRERAA